MGLLAPLFLLLLDVRCVGDFVGTPDQPFGVGRKSVVLVRPAFATLEGAGTSAQFYGEAVDANGFVLVSAPVRWASLNPDVVVVDSVEGRASAVASGQGIIEASAGGGIVGYSVVTVGVPVTPPLAGLDSVTGLTGEQINAVWGTSRTNVYAVGALGTVLHFNGQAWSRADVGGSTRHLWGVWGSSANDVYVVGDSGTVLHFDGSTWRPDEHVPTTRSLHDIWGASPRDFYVVGDGGTILHFESRWKVDTSGTSANLRGVWGVSAQEAWAVGDAGAVLHRDEGRWEAENAHTAAILTDVWGTTAGQVVAVGSGGTALRRSDGVWSAEPTGTSEVLNAVWGTSPRTAVAVGDGGALLRYTGTEWQPVSGAQGAALRAVFGFSSGEIFLAGSDGALLVSGGASSTRLVFTEVPAQAVTAGAPFAAEVRVVDGTGATVASAHDTVTVALAGDTTGAVLLGDTAAVALQGGVARFALALRQAGSRYVLAASAPRRGTVRSPSFVVTPAAAERLVFLVQPAGVPANAVITPAPRVAAVDAFGNVARTYTRDMALKARSPSSHCGELSPAQSLVRTPVAGVAAFDGLFLTEGGNDCTLVATSPGLDTATSNTFQVTAAGLAASVRIVPEDVSALAGDVVTFQVQVLDGQNNLLPITPGVTGANARMLQYLEDALLPGGGTATGQTALGTGQTVVAASVPGLTGYGVLTVSARSPIPILGFTAQQPTANRLNGVWGTSTTAYAVGEHGTVISIDPAGQPTVTSIGSATLRAVWRDGDATMYAVSDSGALFRIDPVSLAGDELARIPGIEFTAIWGGSPGDVFVVGGPSFCLVRGCVYRFDGLTLSGAPGGGGPLGHALWGASRSQLFVPSGNGDLAVGPYTNLNFRQCGAVEVLGAWGTSARNVFLVGRQGTIIRFDGGTCTTMPSPVTTDLYAVSGFGPNDVYAVGDGGTILHYDGTDWTQVSSPTTSTLRAVTAFHQPDVLYAGGNYAAHSFARVVAVGDDGTIVIGQ